VIAALEVVYGVSLVLVFAGLAAIAATRSLVKIIFGLQSMTLGSLLLLAASMAAGGVEGHQVMLLAAAAATGSEATAIAVLILVYKKFKTLDPRRVSELRW